MNINNVVPITKARGRLGDLANLAVASNYFVLTKGGNPSVALVDLAYLKKLESIVKQVTQKTFIDPKLDKFTREFSEKEITEWQSEDQL